MARLRFPGRPGYRFGRLGIKYGPDQSKASVEFGVKLITNVHRGLHYFHELYGESDEDEFDGFSEADVACVVKKLQDLENELQELKKPVVQKPVVSKILPVKISTSHKLKKQGKMGLTKAAAKETYKQLIKDGHAKPMKAQLTKAEKSDRKMKKERVRQRSSFKMKAEKRKISVSKSLKSGSLKRRDLKKSEKDKIIDSDDDDIKYTLSVCDNDSQTKEDSPVKLKRGRGRPPTMSKEKFREKHKKTVIIPKSKKVDTTLAKQLLSKAKKVKQEQKRNSPPNIVQRRQFVLPTVSSRSSRKIIPNKRFIEDGVEGVIFTSPISSKSAGTASESESPTVKRGKKPSVKLKETISNKIAERKSLKTAATLCPESPSPKRGRKPSVKVLEKLSDEDAVEEGSIQIIKAATKKTGHHHSEYESKAAQKRGRSILQKAKLRLNQASLNKSKVALARSLKRQMKKDDQKSLKSHSARSRKGRLQTASDGETTLETIVKPLKSPITSPVAPLKMGSLDKTPKFGTVSMPHVPLMSSGGSATQTFGESSTPKETPVKPKQCLVCEDPCSGDTHNHITATGLCRLCRRAYLYNIKSRARIDRKEQRKCRAGGNCDLHYSLGRRTMQICSSCRFNKSAQIMATIDKDLDTTVDDFEPLQSPQPPVPMLSSPSQNESETAGIPAGVPDDSEASAQPENGSSLHDNHQPALAVEANMVTAEVSADPVASPPPGDTVVMETTTTTAGPGQLIAEGSVEEAEVAEESGVSRGPRIKHVCRRASIAFGKPHATFPFTLSALPSTEKQKILAVEARAHRAEESDSDLSMDEIISRAQEKDDDTVTLSHAAGDPAKPGFRKIGRKTWGTGDSDFDWGEGLSEGDDFRPHKKKPKMRFKKFRPSLLNTPETASTGRGRRVRCRKCPGCIMEDCRKCVMCKDMKKYGGPGKMKQTCVKRKCENPQRPKESKYDPDSGYKVPKQKSPKPSPSKSPGKGPKRSYSKKEDGNKDGMTEDKQETHKSEQKKESNKATDAEIETNEEAGMDRKSADKESTQPEAGKVRKVPISPSKRPALSVSGAGEYKSKKVKKKVCNEEGATGTTSSVSGEKTGRFMTRLPTSVTSHKKIRDPSRPKPKYASNPDSHRIKLQYKADYCIDVAYQEGVALISTLPFSTRLLCLLCGSAGLHKLHFCAVCCEPFHNFCLEPHNRPRKQDAENWCCPRCQFCHVCGKQEKLLKCTKCADTYHSGCLGSNYPTKPTKHKIWLCARCVKCKSCGRTTPGDTPNATWSHDFTLCAGCGRLKDQGHFCPVCHQCYSTDDWDSQMIQCQQCNSWVHSKCEQLTDEMYEIFSLLPEDIPFVCRVCAPTRPAPHEKIIRQEMKASFNSIMEALLSAKCTESLQPIQDEPDVKDPSTTNLESSEPISGKQEPISSSSSVLITEDKTHSCTEEKPGGGESKPHSISMKSDRVLLPREVTRTLSQELGIQDDIESTDSIPTDTSSEGSKPTTPLIFISSNNGGGKDTGEVNSTTSKTSVTSTRVRSQEDTDKDLCVEVVGEDKKAVNSDSGSSRRSLRSGISNSSHSNNTNSSNNGQVRDHPETEDNSSGKGDKHKQGATVTFSEEPNVKSLTEEKKDFPRDLLSVKEKFQEANYKRVADFCGDIVRILRYNIVHEDPAVVVAGQSKGGCQVARSLFLRQMKRAFPWYNANTNTLWEHDRTLPHGMLPSAVLPPSDDHTYAQWRERDDVPQSPPPISPYKTRHPATPGSPLTPYKWGGSPSLIYGGTSKCGEDVRKCALCGEFGDHKPNERGRLVYVGQNEWLHLNCCLWSSIVFENLNGTLQNVFTALSYGRHLVCVICEKKGATVGCCAQGCRQNFHMMCAREAGSLFQTDKNVFCRLHKRHMDGTVMDPDRFSVERRACVDMNTNKWSKNKNGVWKQGVKSSTIQLLVGAMCLESLGHLTQLSDTKSLLLPLDYCVTRVYWSTKDARKKSVYTCRIREVDPHLENPVHTKDVTIVHDPTLPGFDRDLHLEYTDPKVREAKQKQLSPGNSGVKKNQMESTLTSAPVRGLSKLQGPALASSWPSMKPSSSRHQGSHDFLALGSSGGGGELSRGGGNVRRLSSPPPVMRARPASTPIERTTQSQGEANDDDFGLLALVNRLNSAASKNRRRSREKSTDRCSSRDSSATRSASRENSLERSLYSPPPPGSGSITPSRLMSPPPTFSQGGKNPPFSPYPEASLDTTEPVFGIQSASNTFKVLKPISEEVQEKAGERPPNKVLEAGSKMLDRHKMNIPAGARPIGLVVQSRSRSPSLQNFAHNTSSSTLGIKIISSAESVSSHSSIASSTTSSGVRVMYNPRGGHKYVLQRSKSPNLAAGIASSLTAGAASGVPHHSARNVDKGTAIHIRKDRHSVSGPIVHQVVSHQANTHGGHSVKRRSLSTGTPEVTSSSRSNVVDHVPSSQVITVCSSTGVRTIFPGTNITNPQPSETDGSKSISLFQGDQGDRDHQDIFIDPCAIINSGATVTPISKTASSDMIPQVDGLVDEKQSSQDASNLREKVVQKIKAEGMARRSPVDHSPVKCKNCKRVYRTLESYNVHVKTCDFVVSSDEEEEEVDDGALVDDKDEDFKINQYSRNDGKGQRGHRPKASMSSDKNNKRNSPPKTDRRRSRSTSVEKINYDKGKVPKSVKKSPVEKGSMKDKSKQSGNKEGLEGSEDQPQIMYQGVKLIKPPFKRGPGRPRKLRPVLVVPPQRRQKPQEEEAEKSPEFDDEGEYEDEYLEEDEEMEPQDGTQQQEVSAAATASVFRVSEEKNLTVLKTIEIVPKVTSECGAKNAEILKKSSPPPSSSSTSTTALSAASASRQEKPKTMKSPATSQDVSNMGTITTKDRVYTSPNSKQEEKVVKLQHQHKKPSPNLKSTFHSPTPGDKTPSESPQVERVSPFQVVKSPGTQRTAAVVVSPGTDTGIARQTLIPKPVASFSQAGNKPIEDSDTDDCIIVDSETEESSMTTIKATATTSSPSFDIDISSEIRKTLQRLGQSVKSVKVLSKTRVGDESTSATPGGEKSSVSQSQRITVKQPVVVRTVNKGVQKYSSIKASLSQPSTQASSTSKSHHQQKTDLQPTGHVTSSLPSATQPSPASRRVFVTNDGSSVVVRVTSSQAFISPTNAKSSRASSSVTCSPTAAFKKFISATQTGKDNGQISGNSAAKDSPGVTSPKAGVTSPKAALTSPRAGVTIPKKTATSPKRVPATISPTSLRNMLLQEDKQSKSVPTILRRASPSQGVEVAVIRTPPKASQPTVLRTNLSPILPKLTSPTPPSLTSPPIASSTLTNISPPQQQQQQPQQLCLVATGVNQYQVVQSRPQQTGLGLSTCTAASADILQASSNSAFVALKSADGALHMVPQSLFEGNQHLANVGLPIQVMQQPQQPQQLQIAMATVPQQTALPSQTVVISNPQQLQQLQPQHPVGVSMLQGSSSASQVTTVMSPNSASSMNNVVNVGLNASSLSTMMASQGAPQIVNREVRTLSSVPTASSVVHVSQVASSHKANLSNQPVNPKATSGIQVQSQQSLGTSDSHASNSGHKRKIFADDKNQESKFKKPRVEGGIKSVPGGVVYQRGPGAMIPKVGSMQDDIRRRLYAARYKAGLVPGGYDEIKKKQALSQHTPKTLSEGKPSVSVSESRHQHQHPVVYRDSRVHKKPSLYTKKKPATEPLTENLRNAASSHHLIQLSHKAAILPEPAQEEEVKEVPMYTIFGKKDPLSPKADSLTVRKDRPHLRFEIESDDGFKIQADNWDDAWKAVTEKVQDARTNARMKQLSFSGVSGLSMFGLNHSATVYLVEQLFGAHRCRNYSFKYHHYEHDSDDEEPEENASGCARTECFTGERKPYDMFSFLMSRYRSRPLFVPTDEKSLDMAHKSQRRITSLELPLAMRFRHLRENAKEAVGVYRSGIHGRGLFCKREIDAGEMVIEYAGEIFRSNLTDKREKYYESKGIGCYMFRVDDEFVIDATLRGNAARFINHCCDPNCYSKVILVDGVKHIVIFAQKRIQKGEELTYDYKFPIEDVKIVCTCSAKRCRKYLN